MSGMSFIFQFLPFATVWCVLALMHTYLFTERRNENPLPQSSSEYEYYK